MLKRLVHIAPGENDELGVEPLESRLELVLVLDSNDELDSRTEFVLVGRPDDSCVRGRVARGQDRQSARSANRFEVAVGEKRLGAVGLGTLSCFGPIDGHDQRDAVALGYGLAQTSRAGHAAQWYLSGRPGLDAVLRTVANRLELEPVRVEPVGRKTVLPVLRELARRIQDDGLAGRCPLVRCSDDRSARDQKGEVMKTRFAARVGSRFFCLVEEQLGALSTVGPVVDRVLRGLCRTIREARGRA